MRLLLALFAALACASSGPLLGQDEDSSKDSGQGDSGTIRLSTQLGFYDHTDGQGDGNPFLDESLTVIEPVILWDHSVSNDWGYSIKVSYDYVSSASIDRLSEYPAQSGASGDYYIGLDYTSRHRRNEDDWLSWNSHLSVEYDYLSLGLGSNYAAEEDGGARKTTWGVNGFYDIIDVIRWNGDDSEGSDERISLTANWNHYRILTPEWNAEYSATLSAQFGFLETAYNYVAVDDGVGSFSFDNGLTGTAIQEELPDTRLRAAATMRARRWLGEGRAYELGGRLYADDWGVLGLSFEPRYYLPISRELGVRLRYRYYTQTEADDFFDGALTSVANASEFRTQDSDLAAFDSHSVGARFDLKRHSNWHFDVNYVLRSDGLDQIFFSLGYGRTFGQ